MCVYSELTGNSLSFYNQEEAEIIKSVCIVLKMYGNELPLEAFGKKTHRKRLLLNLATTSSTHMVFIEGSKHVFHFSLNQISPTVFIGPSKCAYT